MDGGGEEEKEKGGIKKSCLGISLCGSGKWRKKKEQKYFFPLFVSPLLFFSSKATRGNTFLSVSASKLMGERKGERERGESRGISVAVSLSRYTVYGRQRRDTLLVSRQDRRLRKASVLAGGTCTMATHTN